MLASNTEASLIIVVAIQNSFSMGMDD